MIIDRVVNSVAECPFRIESVLPASCYLARIYDPPELLAFSDITGY